MSGMINNETLNTPLYGETGKYGMFLNFTSGYSGDGRFALQVCTQTNVSTGTIIKAYIRTRWGEFIGAWKEISLT